LSSFESLSIVLGLSLGGCDSFLHNAESSVRFKLMGLMRRYDGLFPVSLSIDAASCYVTP
jgi:hypothetical protein